MKQKNVKEKYFTLENIDETSREIIGRAGSVESDTDPELGNPALLALDMQSYFTSPESHAFIPSADAIVPRINNLIEAFTDKSLPIIFTRHINDEQNAGQMSEWWNDIITEDSPLSKIDPNIKLSNHQIIKKSQYDAFYKTELNDILTANNVTTLVICGVMTHLCCETTARSAFVHGYKVIFPVDGTATYNKEFHISTFRNLFHGFTNPILLKNILNNPKLKS